MGKTALFLAVLVLAGCAVRETFWTKQGASERQFKAISGRCTRWATEEAAVQVGSGGEDICVFDSTYGTVCGRQRDTEQAAWEREGRRKSKAKRLWRECMEDRGWMSNHDGIGYPRT